MAGNIVIDDCKRGFTNKDQIIMEFASTETDINQCNGCNKFIYDGEVCGCEYCNQ